MLGTVDYKGEEALKSCHSEFHRILWMAFFIQGLCRNVSFDAAPFRCVLTCLPDCIFMDYKYKLVISGFSLFYMVEKLLGSYSCTFSSLGIARTCSVLLSAYRKRSSKCTFSRLGIARTSSALLSAYRKRSSECTFSRLSIARTSSALLSAIENVRFNSYSLHYLYLI